MDHPQALVGEESGHVARAETQQLPLACAATAAPEPAAPGHDRDRPASFGLTATGTVTVLRRAAAALGRPFLELRNKLEAFELFQQAPRLLRQRERRFWHFDLRQASRPGAGNTPLAQQVASAQALFPLHLAPWVIEGLGYHHGEAAWRRGADPRELLRGDLPPGSLIALHAGLGLSLAGRALARVSARSAPDLAALSTGFMALCREVSRPGYAEITFEALGFIARMRGRRLVPLLDRELARLDPALGELFWHGAGRALYMLPYNVLPGGAAACRALRMALAEPARPAGRRNAVAGVAWALTLINLRHPELLAACLENQSAALAEGGSFADGVASALLAWHDLAPADPYLEAFHRFQPAAGDCPLGLLWRRQVAGTGVAARVGMPADSAPHAASAAGPDQLFRCPPLGGHRTPGDNINTRKR
ncbi:MAG TPA: hypothetical protein VHR45_19430 [Thermoanaerobaculia bacterium]|nr:hypothetical protein [Thermoanaerobaculia bacterium]